MNKSHRLPIYIKPQRYKIILKPDLDTFTFEGEETIFLTLSKSVKEITLHSAEIEINFVEFAHQPSVIPANAGIQKENSRSKMDPRLRGDDNLNKVQVGKVSYDEKSETATFIFPKKLEKGKGELRLKFKGILNDKMRGFYRSKYVLDGVDKHLATTQFESTDARRAFPCFDEPSHKAVFDITLMIPKGLKAISNTIESEVLEHESGYQILKFAPTPKMSTYLLAFIVGDFEFIEGRTHTSSLRKQGSNKQRSGSELDSRLRGNDGGVLVRVFTTPGKKNEAEFSLDVAIKCLEFYNNYFGIDYPLPVLDMIAIPDFAAGAMENWGAVTYRESTILVDEARSSTANKQWVAMVVAHELAHQWFGNLVTMEWWTHLWLNEGFASFIEYLAIDHIFPEWDIWTQFVSTEMGTAYALDALENTHPIEVEVGHPAEISEIFDKVSYSKGASILRMLHEYLGVKDFQKGLQVYLKKHAYSNAQTEDLWQALEKASGKPVGKIMKNWTGKSGHPLVRVQATGGRLQLTQSRFFSSPIFRRQSKDRTVWSIPLDGILMDKKTRSHSSSGKLNKGEVSLVRVDYPQEYLKKLEEGVKDKTLSAVDRLGLIRDSFDLAQSGNSPTTLALELALSYLDEDNYTVWSQLTGHLSQIDSLLSNEQYYDEFKKYGRRIYKRIAEKMGWEKKQGEKHTDALLRAMVLYKLGSYGDKATIKKAQELFSAFCHPGGSGATDRISGIDPDLRGVVYNLVAENSGQKEWDILVKMYKEEDNQQEKDRLGRSLGLFKHRDLLEKTLEFAISKDVRFQNTLGIIASVWANPNGRYLAWEFVKKNWKMLQERYAGGHYFTRVFGPAGEFTKISDAKDIEDFVKKNPVPEAQRTIAQALEQIYSNAEWLKRDREKIKKYLTMAV